ncbi:hypothetical protein GCM10023201_07170 [Actinomycetospora corticicola]
MVRARKAYSIRWCADAKRQMRVSVPFGTDLGSFSLRDIDIINIQAFSTPLSPPRSDLAPSVRPRRRSRSSGRPVGRGGWWSAGPASDHPPEGVTPREHHGGVRYGQDGHGPDPPAAGRTRETA